MSFYNNGKKIVMIQNIPTMDQALYIIYKWTTEKINPGFECDPEKDEDYSIDNLDYNLENVIEYGNGLFGVCLDI